MGLDDEDVAEVEDTAEDIDMEVRSLVIAEGLVFSMSAWRSRRQKMLYVSLPWCPCHDMAQQTFQT